MSGQTFTMTIRRTFVFLIYFFGAAQSSFRVSHRFLPFFDGTSALVGWLVARELCLTATSSSGRPFDYKVVVLLLFTVPSCDHRDVCATADRLFRVSIYRQNGVSRQV